MRDPWLVVLAGRPGTGKTTLARLLTTELGAAYLRIDAIETAVIRSGLAAHPIGPVGYVVAHDIALATLGLGTSVVVDAVNPVHESRAGWRAAGERYRLAVYETVVPDVSAHEFRVRQRQPDLPGQRIPSWEEVLASEYAPWDVALDGPRAVIDMTDTATGFSMALQFLRDRELPD